MKLSTTSVITTSDLSPGELSELLRLAAEGKKSMWRNYSEALKHKVIALLFFNPSLRTRASFQSGIARLGAQSTVLSPGNDSWTLEFEEGAVMYADRTEHVKDAAQVISQYFDAVCIRAFPKLASWEEDKHESVLEAFKKYLDIPLISMEGSLWHPCQALADALTLQETFGSRLREKTMVVSWAPHPKQLPMAVPHSTALVAAQLGMKLRIACPEGYLFDDEILSQITSEASRSNGSVEIFHEQDAALKGADVVYAKSWTPPMFIGKKELELEHRKALLPWLFDAEKLALGNNARFMHCLPVRRNIEVADEVLDGPQSLTSLQAANRLHAQNALLVSMLGGI